MDSEKKMEALQQELNQMKDNFNEMKADRDRINREYVETRSSLHKAENMNERLLRIIENLSES
ncbi:MAG: hypothetical protein IJZ23_06955 [Roseburia sp.]|nr:hypothetical protein [Roseburia sp.]MBQ8279564.1 hypothetical protein [Roseburia sp.]